MELHRLLAGRRAALPSPHLFTATTGSDPPHNTQVFFTQTWDPKAWGDFSFAREFLSKVNFMPPPSSAH